MNGLAEPLTRGAIGMQAGDGLAEPLIGAADPAWRATVLRSPPGAPAAAAASAYEPPPQIGAANAATPPSVRGGAYAEIVSSGDSGGMGATPPPPQPQQLSFASSPVRRCLGARAGESCGQWLKRRAGLLVFCGGMVTMEGLVVLWAVVRDPAPAPGTFLPGCIQSQTASNGGCRGALNAQRLLRAQAFPETIGEKPPPVVEAQVQRAIEGCVAGCAERLETLACLAWQGWLRCAPSTRLS